MFVYVVIENGDPFPSVYTTYEKAAEAVRAKFKRQVAEDIYWMDQDGMHSVNILHTPESPTGISKMYVEKGIHIEIHRLPVT